MDSTIFRYLQDKIVGRNLPLRREEVSREEAARRIKAINEPYKLEILDSIKTEPITIYHIGRLSLTNPADMSFPQNLEWLDGFKGDCLISFLPFSFASHSVLPPPY